MRKKKPDYRLYCRLTKEYKALEPPEDRLEAFQKNLEKLQHYTKKEPAWKKLPCFEFFPPMD